MAKTKPVDTEATGDAADPANNLVGDAQGDLQGDGQAGPQAGAAQGAAGGAASPPPPSGGSYTRLDDGTLVLRGNDNNAPVGKE